MRILAALLAVAILASGCSDPQAAVPRQGAPLAEGTIAGVVVDEAITPVAGAQVKLNTGEAADTDAAGAFSFAGLAPGEYFVTASKLGYTQVQAAATVEAGAPGLPLRLQVTSIPGKTPYLTPYRMDGFYECGFAGDFVVLYAGDSCDLAWRTAYDAVNGTVGQPPVPRTLQHTENTQIIDVPGDVEAVVLEAHWDDPAVATMVAEMGSLPIQIDCDCSDTYWIEVHGPSPLVGRVEKGDGDGPFLAPQVASRGFLDWNGEPSVAQNFRFTLVTTLFHNHRPAEGWTTATQGQ